MIEVAKGGLILDIGLRGFLPASLVDLRRVRDLHPFVGTELEAKIIELDRNRNNVVPSRRAFLEESQSEGRRSSSSRCRGRTPQGHGLLDRELGAFVDLGGVDGLVHVSELSWKHVDHPSEVVQVGQEVEVEVLDVDLERERVSLSLKATQEDPWKEFERKYSAGEIIDGQVTKLVPFGAFVRVAAGIEGLVHISEISEQHIETPESVLSVGDEVRVKVIEVDVPAGASACRCVRSAAHATPGDRDRGRGGGSVAAGLVGTAPVRPHRRSSLRRTPRSLQRTSRAGARVGRHRCSPPVAVGSAESVEAVEAGASVRRLVDGRSRAGHERRRRRRTGGDCRRGHRGGWHDGRGRASEEDISLEAILEDRSGAKAHGITSVLLVGLTGGIGSGKSTVARLLEERGAACSTRICSRARPSTRHPGSCRRDRPVRRGRPRAGW